MRVLHLTWGLGCGGAENLIIDLANAQSIEHIVEIFVINDDVSLDCERRVLPGVRIVRYGRDKGQSKIRSILAVRSLIRRMGVDVVHCHSETLAPIVWRLPCKVVLTVHNSFGTFWLLGPAFNQIVAISANVKNTVGYLGHQSISVIHNGFDETLFPLNNGCWVPLKVGDVVRFVVVGRLDVSVKRQDVILEAFGALRKSNPYLSFSIDLIGDGPSRNYLQEVVRQMMLTDVVKFVGQISRVDVAARMANYDYIVHGAESEGFGLVIAEAMAAGVIPIVRSNTGAEEVLGPEKCGYVFDNLVTLTACLFHVTKQSGRLEQVRFRPKVVDYARAAFGISSCAAKYNHVYRGR